MSALIKIALFELLWILGIVEFIIHCVIVGCGRQVGPDD